MTTKKTTSTTSLKSPTKKVATKTVTKKVATKKDVTKKNSSKTSVAKPKKSLIKAEDKQDVLLLHTIIDAIEEIKGEKIISIDLRHLPEAIADYFVICEATTNTQLQGICGNIEKRVKEICNTKPLRRNTEKESIWMVLDYVNIIVHLFLPQQRHFYNLEDCWNDGIFTHY